MFYSHVSASPSHRQSVNKPLILNDAQSARLRSDPTLRVLLFCAVEQPLAPFTRLDITFPSQIEVRVNQDEVKANYKGLKNKPGSTRPADITDLLRTTPANYRNTIGITYALTQKASDHQVSYPLPLSSLRRGPIKLTLPTYRNTIFSSTWYANSRSMNWSNVSRTGASSLKNRSCVKVSLGFPPPC